MANEFVDQVTQFQKTYDPENLCYYPKRLEHMRWPDALKLLRLRYKLIAEEHNEFEQACLTMFDKMVRAHMDRQSLYAWLEKRPEEKELWLDAKKEMVDALGDMMVVIIGTALSFGIDIEKVMRRIHASNMSKLDENGKPIYRDDGKVLKGPNYKPPVLEDLI